MPAIAIKAEKTVRVRVSDLNIRQKIQILRQQLRQDCLEREYHIDALLALFITKQHGLLLGPPGTAKTMLLELLCKVFVGAEYFSILIGADTKPDDFFGVVSLNKLRDHEVYQRNTKHRLPQAHLAYLDEIFKAPVPILNQLLKVINERVYYNPHAESIPLRTMVGSSNEIPTDGAAAAFADRFAWKTWVGYLEDDQNIDTLWDRTLDGYKSAVTLRLPLDDLDTALIESQKVAIKLMKPLLKDIKLKLKIAGYVASDRRWQAILKFLQAFAWVRGHDQVTLDDIKTCLTDCIWQKLEDVPAIAQIINQSVDEIANNLSDIKKQAIADFKQFNDVFRDEAATSENIVNKGLEILPKLEKALDKITELESTTFYDHIEIRVNRDYINGKANFIDRILQDKQGAIFQEKIEKIIKETGQETLELNGRLDPENVFNAAWVNEAETLKNSLLDILKKCEDNASPYTFLADVEAKDKNNLLSVIRGRIDFLRKKILKQMELI
jgi:MoxR-like ATPase